MRRKDDERELAEELRRAGRTYDEIAAELGVSKGSLSLWLAHLPHPDPGRPREPGALGADKPSWVGDVPTTTADRRALARELRLQGWLLRELAHLLGVSVPAVHGYVEDLPVPVRARHGGDREHMRAMQRAYYDKVLVSRERQRSDRKAAAAAEVGRVTARELFLAAVTAYWAEGCKSKPYARREQVTFINSDEGMIRLWVAWLDDIEFPEEHRRYSLSIHVTGDVVAATESWAAVLGVAVERFNPPTLKRHVPKTVRLNVGDDYRGCLVVRLVQCRELYQRIEGAWSGIVRGLAG